MDGAGPVKTYLRVVMPLLKPVTGTVVIIVGLFSWNNFFHPLIFLSGSNATSLPLVIFTFVGAEVQQWNIIFAALIISMAPMIVFFVLAQRHLMRGLATGIKE